MQLTEQIGMVLLVFALLGGLLVVRQEARAGVVSAGRAARWKRAASGSIGTRSADPAARFASGARRRPDGVDRHRSVFVHAAGCAGHARMPLLRHCRAILLPLQPMIKFRSILLFLFFAAAAWAAPASDPAIPVFGSANPKGGLTLSTPTQIVILLTLLTLLPAVVMSVSPFLRIIIVLHFLRQALGTQSAPSNQVLVGLSMFLAFLVMQPVVMDIYHRGWEPVENGQVSWEQGFDEGAKPLKNFPVEIRARERHPDLRRNDQVRAAAQSGRSRSEGSDPGLHSLRAEGRLPDRSGSVSAVPDHRSRGGFHHAFGRHGAIAAGDDLGAVQDSAVRPGGRMESGDRLASKNFLLRIHDS